MDNLRRPRFRLDPFQMARTMMRVRAASAAAPRVDDAAVALADAPTRVVAANDGVDDGHFDRAA